tara:strand:- start:141 stop:587 length:447 start_codon:yes stop_codon:yes gene_type:complete
MSLLKEYVEIILHDKPKKYRNKRLKYYEENKLNDEMTNIKMYKLWRNYKYQYYDKVIDKYNIDVDKVNYEFNPKKNKVLYFLKIIHLEGIYEEDEDYKRKLHYIHTRADEIRQSIKVRGSNATINTILDYDRMCFIVENKKSLSKNED